VEEVPGQLITKVISAVEGPLSLVLLLAAFALAAGIIYFIRENGKLHREKLEQAVAYAGRLEKLQELRVEEARKSAPVMDQVIQVMESWEAQTKRVREERSPLVERIDRLIAELEGKPRVRKTL
jgi:uncharacterized protein HemX